MGMKQIQNGQLKKTEFFKTAYMVPGWATLMPFASIYPTDPRTNPWNFPVKILRIGGFKKLSFFELAILEINKKLCLIHSKISQSFLGSKDGSKFWWLAWLY